MSALYSQTITDNTGGQWRIASDGTNTVWQKKVPVPSDSLDNLEFGTWHGAVPNEVILAAEAAKPDKQVHAIFHLDADSGEANGMVDHYCSLACCAKARDRYRTATTKVSYGVCSDYIEDSVCSNCGIPFTKINDTADLLFWTILANEGVLSEFPGDHYSGNITGHGSEWRTEFTIDYCPSDESEETENEYSLVFSLNLFADKIKPSLELHYVVAEVGVEEKHSFDVGMPASFAGEMDLLADQWDMHKTSLSLAQPLFNKIIALRAATLDSSPIDWNGRLKD